MGLRKSRIGKTFFFDAQEQQADEWLLELNEAYRTEAKGAAIWEL